MLFQRLVAVLSVVGCVVCQSQVAEAQARGQRRMQPVRVSGKVHAVGPRGLQIVADNGTAWVVQPPDKVEAINFTGTASVDWLQRGMFVRFSTTLNKELEAQEPIRELTVITIRPGVEPGVFQEGEAVAGDGNEGGTEEKGRDSRRKAQNKVVPCLVIGRLYAAKNGVITVATVGRNIVKASLAVDVAISVQMNDFRVARQGDKVDFSGLIFPEQPGRAKARSITITAAKPLGSAQTNDGREKDAKKTKAEKKKDG